MVGSSRAVIRPFAGSLAEAEGVLAVERATFDESPYTPEQVQKMLVGGPQYAWLALQSHRAGMSTAPPSAPPPAVVGDGGEGAVVGFVIAFATGGLHGQCWEMDLLAVHPEWRGRGLATRLIRAAAAYGAHVAPRTRSAVAVRNGASARAFSRAGYRLLPEVCKLLICRTAGLDPRPGSSQDVHVREAPCLAAAAAWLPDGLRRSAFLTAMASKPKAATALSAASDQPGLVLLLAERNGHPAGYAELLEVQTLLYRGVWIESLVAPARAAREALLHYAVNRTIDAGLDEIGAMVREGNWPLHESLMTRGFRSLGDFCWLTAHLPLPGLAGARGAVPHTT